MNDGGNNQAAPIVHNGVLYLNNPNNTLQALDARTGELIWENRYGGLANASSMRGMAIYEDKIFVSTSDARLIAFDARNGKKVWETVIGDRSKGNYATSSGPIVIKGKVLQGLGGCERYRDEKCFISAYDAGPASRFGDSTRLRARASRAAIPGASFRICCERAAKPGSPAATIPILI